MATLQQISAALQRQLVQRLPAQITAVMERAGQEAVRQIRASFVPYGSGDATHLQIRSGDLSRAVGFQVVTEGDGKLRLRIGVLTPDQHIQMVGHAQEAGIPVISAKNVAKMAIPVGAMLDSRGVRRFPTVAAARSEYVLAVRPRVIKGYRRGTPSRSRTVLYVRRRTVRLPARPFVGPVLETASQNVAQGVADAMGAT